MTTESAASQRSRAQLARKAIPRSELGVFTPVDRDPVALIKEQDKGRVKALVPLRHERMSASLFTFYRGTAGLMAHDLAQQAQTDTHLVICGDAHLNNFGLYASPERRLVFDLNDFDEAAPGPWEWDVKRLLTSAILAAEEIDATPEEVDEIVLTGAKAYRTYLDQALSLPALERHYMSLDSTQLAHSVREDAVKQFDKTTKKAQRRDSDRAIAKMMQPDRMGFMRFKEEPPILTHDSLRSDVDFDALFAQYFASALPDISYLLSRFTMTDVAFRVVGVGSVGTRCHVIALTGPENSGIILQTKEARQSVVTQYSTPNVTTPATLRPGMEDGERVVTHQRILQAVSDAFLGHLKDGKLSFYVRQFRDSKGSFDTRSMNVGSLTDYVALCASILARAHSQSSLAHWVSGYIGDSTVFDKAMLSWCRAYQEQTKSDYAAYLAAYQAGKLTGEDSSSLGGKFSVKQRWDRTGADDSPEEHRSQHRRAHHHSRHRERTVDP